MGSWTATATRAGGLGPKEERLKIVPVGRARARVPSFVLLFSERTKGGPRCSTRALDSGYGSLFFAGSGSGSGFGWLWLSGSLALWLLCIALPASSTMSAECPIDPFPNRASYFVLPLGVGAGVPVFRSHRRVRPRVLASFSHRRLHIAHLSLSRLTRAPSSPLRFPPRRLSNRAPFSLLSHGRSARAP